MSATTTSARPQQVSTSGVRSALAATGVAAAGNVLLWMAAALAGVNFTVTRPDGSSFAVNVVGVLVMTLVPMLLGAGVLALAVRRSRSAVRMLSWVGLTLGVLTVPMPFAVAATLAAQVVLAVMHVVAGVSWFVLLRREPRSVTP